MAEVNWNEKSQKFEVALCLWPADLEKALQRQAGRPIDIAKDADIDQLMAAYIGKRFTIDSKPYDTERKKMEDSPTTGPTDRDATNKTVDHLPRLKWHGHEANAKEVWLYFEVTGDSKANWTVENRVFFELNDDQLNHIPVSYTHLTLPTILLV